VELFKYLLGLSVVLLVAFVILDKELLVGTWDSADKSEFQTIILKNDNIFLQIVPYNEDDTIVLDGSYKLVKDSIHFLYPDTINAGYYKIEKLDKMSLRLSKTVDGETMNFDFIRRK
jgi:hypothetical protein